MSKSLFASKTFWMNVALPAILAALKSAGYHVTMEEAMAVIGAINIILRYVTTQPVHLTTPSA